MSGFDKLIPSEIKEYEIYNVHSQNELVKIASGHADLPEGFTFDPDCLYLWIRIVSAGEAYGPNKNGDYFPESELLGYYDTFKNAHTFKNHENKKVENAIGKIISVRWDPIMKCVEIFKSIDKKIAPEIARGYLKGYLTDVSMGCRVPYTICSICGNKARKKSEFCEHVNLYRMQYLANGERVFEVNFEPNFHDSSTVLTGAERVAKAMMIIEAPPEGAQPSFQKAASSRSGVTRYVRLFKAEHEKVAAYQDTLHPLLLSDDIQKVAAAGFIHKLAEIEKDITGKLLNIVSVPEADKEASAAKMISLIKFLTDRRFDQDTVSSLGQTLVALAKSEKISQQRVFTIFLGIAELLGIELYPSELHGILSELTDAGLNKNLNVSEGNGENLYPVELNTGAKQTMEATEQLPAFESPGSLVDLYQEGAHQEDMLRSNPFEFMKTMMGQAEPMNDHPPIHVVKIIRQTLSPFMPVRSTLPEHALPRLAAILSGFNPAVGGAEARRDFDILAHPQSLGDMLATFAYRNYQDMRPDMVRTKFIRLAMQNDHQLEKIAGVMERIGDIAKAKPEGIGRGHLLLFGAPAIYGASAFQKSRRKHDRNLSDAENFLADRPGLISAGVIAGGKPLTKAIAQGGVLAAKGVVKAKDAVENLIKHTSDAHDFYNLVKIADSFSPGRYSAFGEDTLVKFAFETGLSGEKTAALKMATLLSLTNMEKEAREILSFYDLPDYTMGMFLKTAAATLETEFEKAANDFTNNLMIDGLIAPHAMAGTLPGRMVDSFLVSRLTKKPKAEDTSEVPKEGSVQNGVS
jgi:hypothetical protein